MFAVRHGVEKEHNNETCKINKNACQPQLGLTRLSTCLHAPVAQGISCKEATPQMPQSNNSTKGVEQSH